MSWKRNEQAHWTNVDDVSSNDHDASVRDYDSAPRTIAYTHDTRPYLQLPHLLSLTWLAYPIISLVFIVFRLQISSDQAKDAAQNVKDDLIASCRAAERAATSAASMPRYLAIATNRQITDAVNGTMNAARATMVLALTIMEAIINFVIDIYRSTFLCFLELVVRGALSILLGAVDAINSGLSTTFNAIRSNIQDDIGGINKLIDAANSAIDKIPFGAVPKIPTVSVPNLDGLQNVQLPSDFSTALQNLNNSLPTIADLKNKIEDIVDTPFELVKKDINDTFAGISFDANTLPLPSQNSVTFCDQMDTSVVDGLSNDLVKIVRIGTAILIVLIVLLIAANCALEWYKWRAMQTHFQRVRQAFVGDPGVTTVTFKGDLYARTTEHDLMSIEGTIGHPWVAKLVLQMQDKLKLRQATKDKLIWFFNYVFFPPALACFLIGVFGLLSVELQLLAIGPIQRHYEQQAASSVSDISNLVATSINASMYNDSATYASQVNARVDAVQSTINDGMFGWVNGTTTTLNETVNAFYTDVQNLVNTVFGNTILNDPVQEFVRCFIGSKVDAIEAALTFLHDNLHVDIPRVNDTVLVLSPDSVNEAAQPIALAAIGDGNGDDQGIVGRVVAIYVKSLKKERIMFAIFAGLWLVVVFMAICFLLWESYGPYRRRRAPASVTVVSPFPPPRSDPALGEMHEVPLQDEKPQASAGPFRGLASSTKNFYGSGLRSLMHPKAKGQTSGPGVQVEQYSEKAYPYDQPQQPPPLAVPAGGSSNHWNIVRSMKNFVPHPSRKKVAFDTEKFAPRSASRDEELGLPSPRNDPFSDKHSVEEPMPEPYESRHPQYEHSNYGYPYYSPPSGEQAPQSERSPGQSLTELPSPTQTRGPMSPPGTPSNNDGVSPGEQRSADTAFDHDPPLPSTYTLTPGAEPDAFFAHPLTPDPSSSTNERSIADHAHDASSASFPVPLDLYQCHSSPSFPEQQCTTSDPQHPHPHPLVAQSLLYTAPLASNDSERYPEHSPHVSQPLSVPINRVASYAPSVSPYPSPSPSPTVDDRCSQFFELDDLRPEAVYMSDPDGVHPDTDIESDVHADVSPRLSMISIPGAFPAGHVSPVDSEEDCALQSEADEQLRTDVQYADDESDVLPHAEIVPRFEGEAGPGPASDQGSFHEGDSHSLASVEDQSIQTIYADSTHSDEPKDVYSTSDERVHTPADEQWSPPSRLSLAESDTPAHAFEDDRRQVWDNAARPCSRAPSVVGSQGWRSSMHPDSGVYVGPSNEEVEFASEPQGVPGVVENLRLPPGYVHGDDPEQEALVQPYADSDEDALSESQPYESAYTGYLGPSQRDGPVVAVEEHTIPATSEQPMLDHGHISPERSLSVDVGTYSPAPLGDDYHSENEDAVQYSPRQSAMRFDTPVHDIQDEEEQSTIMDDDEADFSSKSAYRVPDEPALEPTYDERPVVDKRNSVLGSSYDEQVETPCSTSLECAGEADDGALPSHEPLGGFKFKFDMPVDSPSQELDEAAVSYKPPINAMDERPASDVIRADWEGPVDDRIHDFEEQHVPEYGVQDDSVYDVHDEHCMESSPPGRPTTPYSIFNENTVVEDPLAPEAAYEDSPPSHTSVPQPLSDADVQYSYPEAMDSPQDEFQFDVPSSVDTRGVPEEAEMSEQLAVDDYYLEHPPSLVYDEAWEEPGIEEQHHLEDPVPPPSVPHWEQAQDLEQPASAGGERASNMYDYEPSLAHEPECQQDAESPMVYQPDHSQLEHPSPSFYSASPSPEPQPFYEAVENSPASVSSSQDEPLAHEHPYTYGDEAAVQVEDQRNLGAQQPFEDHQAFDERVPEEGAMPEFSSAQDEPTQHNFPSPDEPPTAEYDDAAAYPEPKQEFAAVGEVDPNQLPDLPHAQERVPETEAHMVEPEVLYPEVVEPMEASNFEEHEGLVHPEQAFAQTLQDLAEVDAPTEEDVSRELFADAPTEDVPSPEGQAFYEQEAAVEDQSPVDRDQDQVQVAAEDSVVEEQIQEQPADSLAMSDIPDAETPDIGVQELAVAEDELVAGGGSAQEDELVDEDETMPVEQPHNTEHERAVALLFEGPEVAQEVDYKADSEYTEQLAVEGSDDPVPAPVEDQLAEDRRAAEEPLFMTDQHVPDEHAAEDPDFIDRDERMEGTTLADESHPEAGEVWAPAEDVGCIGESDFYAQPRSEIDEDLAHDQDLVAAPESIEEFEPRNLGNLASDGDCEPNQEHLQVEEEMGAVTVQDTFGRELEDVGGPFVGEEPAQSMREQNVAMEDDWHDPGSRELENTDREIFEELQVEDDNAVVQEESAETFDQEELLDEQEADAMDEIDAMEQDVVELGGDEEDSEGVTGSESVLVDLDFSQDHCAHTSGDDRELGEPPPRVDYAGTQMRSHNVDDSIISDVGVSEDVAGLGSSTQSPDSPDLSTTPLLVTVTSASTTFNDPAEYSRYPMQIDPFVTLPDDGHVHLLPGIDARPTPCSSSFWSRSKLSVRIRPTAQPEIRLSNPFVIISM